MQTLKSGGGKENRLSHETGPPCVFSLHQNLFIENYLGKLFVSWPPGNGQNPVESWLQSSQSVFTQCMHRLFSQMFT